MYTWLQKKTLKQARLDFFLVSSDFMPFVDSVDIKPAYKSDHSMVVLSCKFTEFIRGRGVWKFNNSLLRDHTYVQEIKNTIKNVVNQYSENPTKELYENLDYNLVTLNINDQLFLETLLMEIRGKTIEY